CRRFGRPREELIGRRFLDFLDESARDHHEQYTAALLTHPHTAVDVHQVVLPDGSIGWQQWVDHPIYDAEGHVVEIQAVGRDITDLKRAEAALRESEARFRAAFESAAVGMALVGLDSHPLEVNHALVAMLGYAEEEMRTHAFAEFTVPEDVEPNLTLFRQAVAGNLEHYHVEKRYLHKDGHVVWGHVSAGVVRDVAGKPLYLVAHVQDITERKQAEQAVRESEARYRAVVSNFPQGTVLLFGEDLRHSFADGPGLQTAGLTRVGVEGKTVWEAFPPDVAGALEPSYRAALAGRSVSFDLAHDQQIYSVQVVPILHSATRQGMVIFQEVTEQRRTRDELEREHTRATLLDALNQEFRTLAEHSPDLIARFDRAGRIRYINQPGAERLGLPAEHWVGKTLAELGTLQEVYEPCAQALRDVVETRAPRTVALDVQAPQGQVRFLHVRFVPELAEDDGALLSVLGIATDVSALKQAEALLAEQASELDAIFEAQADGVAVYDLQGRFVRANRALRQLLGFEADAEYTARPLEERAQRLLLFDEQGQQVLPEQWPHWRVLRGEILAGASAMEARVRTVDGRELWISTTGAPVRAPDGQVTGTVLITRDVTARRTLERQVAEQAAELEAVFEAMTDGIAVLDAQGHVIRVNPAAQALFTLAIGEDLALEAIEPTAAERARALDLRDSAGQPIPRDQLFTTRLLRGEVLAGATALTVQLGTHPDRIRCVNLTGGPLRDAATGQIIGAVGVARDVTELQRVQAALAEQERLFRTLVEHSPDIIARFDRELRYLYVNPAIHQVSPLPETAYIGKTNAELGWPEAAYAPAHRAIEQVFQTGAPQALEEIDVTSPDPDAPRYLRAQILPECTDDGQVESVLTVTTDITALKRTEQALREANASIESARQEEERRKRIAESLRGMLAVLNSTRSPREVLQYIVGQVEELLYSAAAVIYGPDDLADSLASGVWGVQAGAPAALLRVQAVQGLRIGGRPARSHQRLPFTDPAVEQVLVSAQPVAVVDDRGGPSSGAAGGASDEADGHATIPVLFGSLPAPYHAVLVVPIRVHDGVYGCLLLFFTQPARFSAEEVALAQAYADQVAQAITNARLQAHIEQEATAAERNRLARELHDTVTQEIFSASLLAEAIPRLWSLHRADAEASLEQLHGIARGALAGLRALLFELRPTVLEQVPLADALRQLGAATSLRAGLPITVEIEGVADHEPRLPAAVKLAFYRLAQEALMNAAKHARARTISLRLRTTGEDKGGERGGDEGENQIELEVRDDGRGFDPGAVGAGHFGLAMMRERAQAIGATVHLRSQVGQGTQLVVRWQGKRGVAATHREREGAVHD
ncbi:MAG TPA: PAS domain S-box protein, partial [Ktedonobacterales bacterium]|nr:PAS domain S-box protein [Ktedonobacterales bacterium]